MKITIFLLVLVHFAISSMAYKVTSIEPYLSLGEAPHWDKCTQSLYYVDLFGVNNTIFRYDYHTGRVYPASILGESQASFITPIEGCQNQFAVGLERSVKLIEWDGVSPVANVICTAFSVEANIPTNRMSDAKADPHGRFYGGTLTNELCTFSSATSGSFYRYIQDKGVTQVFGDVKISNGLAWNEDKNKMYYSDTCRQQIVDFDWDPATGDLCNGRVAFSFRNSAELLHSGPDGMTIDTNGFLYSAVVNGSAVWKINPFTSQLVEKIEMPTQIITSAAFGGPDLDILFVTSGGLSTDIFTGENKYGTLTDSAGSLFMVTDLGTKGFAGTKLESSFEACAPCFKVSSC